MSTVNLCRGVWAARRADQFFCNWGCLSTDILRQPQLN